MSKREQRLSVAYAEEEMLVKFNVLNSLDVSLAAFTFDFNDVHESLQARVSLYGLNKLLTDRTSDKKDKLEKLDSMEAVMDQLTAGEWAKERVVGSIIVGAAVEALARIKEITVPQAQKALASYDKDARAKILANPKIVEMAEHIKEERSKAKEVSLDDLA